MHPLHQAAAKELLEQIQDRLPELAWHLSKQQLPLKLYQLPQGLFRSKTSSQCISELQEDLSVLAKQQEEASALFLAKRLQQKINVLVSLCCREKSEEAAPLHLSMQDIIKNRAEKIEGLSQQRKEYESQYQALCIRLNILEGNGEAEAVLTIKKEIGALRRLMTLNQESIAALS